MKISKIFQSSPNLTYKQVKNRRSILAFFLFVCIVITTVCASGGVGVSNDSEIASALLKSSYINALTNDVEQYTNDLCDEAGIPKDFVTKSINYSTMYELERSYIYSTIIETPEYNQNAFLANVIHLKESVRDNLTLSLGLCGFTVDEQMQEDIEQFSTDVSDYAKNRIRFQNEGLYIENLKTAKLVNQILVIVGIVLGVLIIIKLLYVGNKKYRSLRYAIYSFSGAALYNFVSSIIFHIIRHSKGSVIYPSYLQNAIDSYISACSYHFVVISLFVLFAAVCVAAISWIMKRRNV